jgi:hypothetical protein
MLKSKNKLYKILGIFFLIVMSWANSYSQEAKNINLEDKIKRVYDSSTYIYFLLLDTIVNRKNKLSIPSLKELNKVNDFFDNDFYYYVKVGYYSKDSSKKNQLLSIFSLIKKKFKACNNKKVIKIDYNCQSNMTILSDVVRYEEETKKEINDVIILTIKKKKEKINKLNYRTYCYF